MPGTLFAGVVLFFLKRIESSGHVHSIKCISIVVSCMAVISR